MSSEQWQGQSQHLAVTYPQGGSSANFPEAYCLLSQRAAVFNDLLSQEHWGRIYLISAAKK